MKKDFPLEHPWLDEAQAVLPHFRRLAFVNVIELLGSTKNVTCSHLHGIAVFVEKGVLAILPRGVRERIAPPAALSEPKVPLTIDVCMVEVEDGVLRRGRYGPHPASHFDVNAPMRTLDDAVGGQEVELAEGKTNINRARIKRRGTVVDVRVSIRGVEFA